MSLADYRFGPSQSVQETLGKPKKTRFTLDIEALNQDELLSLRDKIDEKLGGTELKDINIVTEMVLQLKKARLLQDEVSEDEEVPANQKAQVQNSLASIIASLAKLQNTTYTSERLKRMEGAIIRCIKQQPKDLQEKFFADYEIEAAHESL